MPSRTLPLANDFVAVGTGRGHPFPLLRLVHVGTVVSLCQLSVSIRPGRPINDVTRRPHPLIVDSFQCYP